MSEEETIGQLELLVEDGIIVQLSGGQIVQMQTVVDVKEQIKDALKNLHKTSRLSLGFPKHEIFRQLNANRIVVDKALENLIESKIITENESGLQLSESVAQLSPRQRKMADKILGIYQEQAFRAPRKDELPLLIGAPSPIINPVLAHLMQAGELVRVADKIILHCDHLKASREAIINQINSTGSLDASSCKELLDTTRKYAIPIMEYWDKQGLTKRVGNNRLLR